MISGLLTLLLKGFDFIAYEVLGLYTLDIVEAMTDVIYFLEGFNL